MKRPIRLPHELRQALFYALGLLIMKGVSFLMLPVTTSYLPAAEYGRLDVLITWMSLGGILLGLGLTEAMYRYCGFAKDSDSYRRTASVAFVTNTGIAVAIFFFAVPFVEHIINWLPGKVTKVQWLLASATLTISACINIPLAWLRLRERAGLFFLISTGKALLQALTTLVFLRAGWGIEGVLWSGLVSASLMAILLIRVQSKDTALVFDPELAQKLLKYGSPLILSGFLVFLGSGAEKWLLAGMIDTTVLAHYAIASQFALLVAFAIEPFTLWWFPKRFAILQQMDGRNQNARFATLGSITSFASALGVAVLGPIIISRLLPEAYHPAIELLPWLCIGMALKQCSHIMNTGCYVGATTLLVTRLNAWMAIISITIYYLGVTILGVDGLVKGFAIIYSIRVVLFYIASQRALPLNYAFKPLLGCALISCAGILNIDLTLPLLAQLLLLLLSLVAMGMIVVSSQPLTNHSPTRPDYSRAG
ncbi:MAG: oligosaccharide flippase family protein [Hahellaceae bacterium]|nr:oligosaccharide flippase family protein [Hahellaceae bacterium]